MAFVGIALQVTEFRPNVEQTPQTELMLRILVSVFPLLFCLGAAAIVAMTAPKGPAVVAVADAELAS